MSYDCAQQNAPTPLSFADRAALITPYDVPVMPLLPLTKDAFLPEWPNHATTDEAQIATWNEKNRQYNCGSVALAGGFWIFDVDDVSLFKRIQEETGHSLDELDTLTVCSSGAKRHFYFKHDSRSEAMGNKTCKDRDEKELFSARAHNMYVVAPGSIHPDTGKAYDIVHEPSFAEIPVAPAWLTDWIARQVSTAPKPVGVDPEVIPEGGRDNWLFEKACRFRDMQCSQALVLDLLHAANKHCKPPMPESVVAAKVASAFKRPPRVANDPKPFVESGTSPTHDELEFHLPAVVDDGIDDFVVQPSQGEKDGWFPFDAPSLIGGASGSSKTTWMLQLLLAQLRRELVLGHATSGRPFLVLMTDRGEKSHRRTLRRLRMEPESIPIRFFAPKVGVAALQEIVNLIESMNPLPQVVFIEGADFLVEDGNKKQFVAPFMAGLKRIAEHYHLAIIGSVGAPKSKAGEGYIAKRDNISGTEAWSRLAETVALLQYPKGSDMVGERELSVQLRNGPAESFALVFKQGRLVLQTEADKRHADGQGRELDWVRKQAREAATDPKKKWWTRLDMKQALDMPKTTVQDWVEHACSDSKRWIVEKPGRKGRGSAAEYQWNASKTNSLWVEHDSLWVEPEGEPPEEPMEPSGTDVELI